MCLTVCIISAWSSKSVPSCTISDKSFYPSSDSGMFFGCFENHLSPERITEASNRSAVSKQFQVPKPPARQWLVSLQYQPTYLSVLCRAHHGSSAVSPSSPAKLVACNPTSKIKFPLKPGMEVSLSEAASVRTASVKEQWQLADATCVKKHKLKPRVLKKRKGWKTIRLFVSSTFTDFYSEREILVKEVCSTLSLCKSVV